MFESILNLVLDPTTLSAFVAVLVAFNVILGGISKILDLVKDKTKTDVDNKTHAFIQKMVLKLQKLIDWMGANREHKKEIK
jgi:hypothetical protein